MKTWQTVLISAFLIIGLSFIISALGQTDRPPETTSNEIQSPVDSDSGANEFGNARRRLLGYYGIGELPENFDVIFADILNQFDVRNETPLVFIDSLAVRLFRGVDTSGVIEPARLEEAGAGAWAALNGDQSYPSGFASALIHQLQSPSYGEESDVAEEKEGEDLIAPILFALIIIILAAKLGGDLVERFRQPAVLGELIFGMILGNLALIGIDVFEPLRQHITIEILAEIGVILLLFEVGLESSLKEMLSVGLTSFFVALIGVIVPFFLGWWVSAMFFPEESIFIHIFIGATLTATSVGITARVLKDIGKIRTRESKIILGAAVFDDIMGLVVLAVVVGVIDAHNTGGTLSSLKVLWIVAKAFLFIVGAVSIGTVLAPHFFKLASKLRSQAVLITFSLMFCFVFALVADKIGLAPIVGAFAAGMILSGVNFKDIFAREERKLEDLLSPITAFLVPIFFVYMGMNVDLSTFGKFNVILFALILTVAAIVGKQICSLAGVFERKINSWAIGIGMIPRGEVGLIFAGIGAKMQIDGIKVVNPDAYSAVVIMVMITTLVTPPFLKLIFSSKAR